MTSIQASGKRQKAGTCDRCKRDGKREHPERPASRLGNGREKDAERREQPGAREPAQNRQKQERKADFGVSPRTSVSLLCAAGQSATLRRDIVSVTRQTCVPFRIFPVRVFAFLVHLRAFLFFSSVCPAGGFCTRKIREEPVLSASPGDFKRLFFIFVPYAITRGITASFRVCRPQINVRRHGGRSHAARGQTDAHTPRPRRRNRRPASR